jgi:hypothetical protein
MIVMVIAVPHFSLTIVDRCSAMIEIRLTIICIRSWTSKTQKKRIKNNTGTLETVSTPLSRLAEWLSYVGPMIPSKKIHPMIAMMIFARISPQSM